jgi:hypothetical protein
MRLLSRPHALLRSSSIVLNTILTATGSASHSVDFAVVCCRGKLNALLPEADFGPNLNFISLKTEDWINSPYGWMLEKPPMPCGPVDLYTAQKCTRATRLTQPPGVRRPAGVCAPAPLTTLVAAASAPLSSTKPPAAVTTATAPGAAPTTTVIKRFYFF